MVGLILNIKLRLKCKKIENDSNLDKGAKMNKQKIIILAVSVLLLLTGCKENNQEYRDMPNSLIGPMLKEWVSPDGVHYWMYCDDYCRGLTPRYDNKGNLVIESNY